MEYKEKKRPKVLLIVFITVLITLALEAGGYYVYKEYFEKKEEPKTVKKEKKEIPVEEITASEQMSIMKNIDEYLFFGKYYPMTDVSVIDQQDLLRFAIYNLEKKSSDLSKANVEAVIKNYFGSEMKVSETDVICLIDQKVLYKYDSDTQKFELNTEEHEHGKEGYYRADFEYISGTKKKDEYTIKVKVIYYSYCSGVCGPVSAIYKTPQDSLNNTNRILTLKTPAIEDLEDDEKKEILDKLPETIYTYKKVNNSFILKSITEE